jgi:hypothetical protein
MATCSKLQGTSAALGGTQTDASAEGGTLPLCPGGAEPQLACGEGATLPAPPWRA